MNILIISAVFPPEPVVSAKLSFDIAEALAKQNIVTVLVPEPSRPLGYKFDNKRNDNKFKIVQSNSFVCAKSSLIGRLRESYSFGKYCAEYILENKKDITLLYVNTWPLFAQFFVVREAKKNDIPVILHVQDIYPESIGNRLPGIRYLINWLLIFLDKFILRNADKIIVISKAMKDYLVKTRYIAEGKFHVVQNWQNEEDFIKYRLTKEKHEKSSSDPFTFMYMGNIGPLAGVDLLIDAFVKAAIKNSKLIIGGSGSMKSVLEKKVKQLGIESVEFINVPDGYVPEIQSRADVMMLPVKKSGAQYSVPSKLVAYMFSAKPIIASVDLDSHTAQTIINAECGWVVSPEQVDLLSAKMQIVAETSRNKLEQFGKNGFDYAIQNLSKYSNLEQVLLVINLL